MTETKVVKVTKRMNINSLLERTDLTENERAYLLHELELIDKKNAYKESKKSAENIELENGVYSILEENKGKGITCSFIASELSKIFNQIYTPQKIQPRLKSLVSEEKVVNYKEKGVSLFKVAE